MTAQEMVKNSTVVSGLRISYRDVGQSEEVLVLLHGGGPGASGSSNFHGNIDALSKRFRLIIPDLPGFGESDKKAFEGDYWKLAASCVDSLLEELGIASAHFIGNSLGGGTTLRLALDYPERVRRIILLGPAGASLSVLTPRPSEGVKVLSSFYDPPGPSVDRMEAFVRMMVFDAGQIQESFIQERFAAATAEGAQEGATSAVRSVLSSPEGQLWRRLSEVQHETLLVWGRDDRVVPVDGALFALQEMPRADLHVFGRCGHWAQSEQREDFEALALAFLTRGDD
jgi:pimeloyl-ACP methyl ester carboxylesterase